MLRDNIYNELLKKLLILFSFALMITSCQTTEQNKTDSTCNKYLMEKDYDQNAGCWYNEDSYRVKTMGYPIKNISPINKRKISAKRAAILNAQYVFMDSITKPWYKTIDDYTKKVFPKGGNIDITFKYHPQKVFGPIAMKGIVIDERYDKNESCYIIYEVKQRGLKKKVEDFLKEHLKGL